MASIFETWAAMPGFSQVANDPRYLIASPAFRQRIHDILFKYGLQPNPDQANLLGGMTVENNPYSVMQLLRNQQQTSNHSTINTASNAGLEESGAAISGLNANTEDFKHGVSDAGSAAQGELQGAIGDFTTLVGGLFDSAQQNPVTQAAAPGADVGPGMIPGPNTHVSSSAALSQPGADIGGSKAAASVASRLKKPKIGIKGSHGLVGF